jgi:hypothetical protein
LGIVAVKGYSCLAGSMIASSLVPACAIPANFVPVKCIYHPETSKVANDDSDLFGLGLLI